MKPILVFSCIAFGCARLWAEDFTTTDGKKYQGVTVSRVEPDGLMVVTDSGIAKIFFARLPEDVQKRFHYDPKAAAEFSAALAKSAADTEAKKENLLREQQRLQDEQRKMQDEQRAKKSEAYAQEVRKENARQAAMAVENTCEIRAIQVIQVMDDGVLAHLAPAVEVFDENARPKKSLGFRRKGDWQDEVVFIYLKNTEKLLDGDKSAEHLYPVGRLQYTAVLGATKTVASYAVTPENATQPSHSGLVNPQEFAFAPAAPETVRTRTGVGE